MIPKFRAWSTFHNKWVKHFYITENGLIYNMEQPHRDLIGAVPIEKSGLVVMQSTWLFDKNGREIFAGDIIEQEGVFAVIRLDNTFGIYFELENGEFDFPEVSVLEELEEGREQASIYLNVVGNIYENKELLEKTK